MMYPADDAGRERLAQALIALGLKPTQAKRNFARAKIEIMAQAFVNGSFDWNAASLQPVIMGPNGEIMGGHHRVVAAQLAGVDLTAIAGLRPQVRYLPMNYRPVFEWLDVLPDA